MCNRCHIGMETREYRGPRIPCTRFYLHRCLKATCIRCNRYVWIEVTKSAAEQRANEKHAKDVDRAHRRNHKGMTMALNLHRKWLRRVGSINRETKRRLKRAEEKWLADRELLLGTK